MTELGKIVSLDIGQKVIGCAVCDENRILVTPVLPIIRKNGSLSLGQFKKLFQTYKPSLVLVGVPINMDGSKGTMFKKIKAFIKKLQKHFPAIDFEVQDEKLSTWTVKTKYSHLKLTKNNSQQNIDSFAAMEILEDYLKLEEY